MAAQIHMFFAILIKKTYLCTQNNTMIFMKPYTEYEKFTQEVYQQLSNYHHWGIKNIQHNIKLKGRSGCEHQIDVYWEYEKDGVSHRVAIECKNYNNRVSKRIVCAFQGVLDDLDGVEGIMVSKKGYQQGAKEYAKQYDIMLKELREPGVRESIIGNIEIHIHNDIRHTLFKVDEKWAEERGINISEYKRRTDMLSIRNDHKWSNATHIPLPINDDKIIDSKGNVITSLESLEDATTFEDAYVSTSCWGPVKILEVKHGHSTEDTHRSIAIDAEGFVKAILKDVFSHNTEFMVLR
jgi:hypothetical protein